MEHISPDAVWTAILAAASALVLLANAVEKVVLAVRAAKAPERKQSERIGRLEKDVAGIKDKLAQDKARLDDTEKSTHLTQQALLALLEHGLNGNNTEQMVQAKHDLQSYLINH